MGQFTPRPEEPTDWAGLPSEPMRSRSDAEALASPIDSSGSLDILGGAVESVVIPLAPTVEVVQTAAEPTDPPREED